MKYKTKIVSQELYQKQGRATLLDDGFAWKKAGVMMLDLTARGAAPLSLFDAIATHDDGLMNAMGALNQKYGRGSIRLGLAGKDQEWRMRRDNLSPSYTTKWADLAKVVMG